MKTTGWNYANEVTLIQAGSETGITDRQFRIGSFFWQIITPFIMHFYIHIQLYDTQHEK